MQHNISITIKRPELIQSYTQTCYGSSGINEDVQLHTEIKWAFRLRDKLKLQRWFHIH